MLPVYVHRSNGLRAGDRCPVPARAAGTPGAAHSGRPRGRRRAFGSENYRFCGNFTLDHRPRASRIGLGEGRRSFVRWTIPQWRSRGAAARRQPVRAWAAPPRMGTGKLSALLLETDHARRYDWRCDEHGKVKLLGSLEVFDRSKKSPSAIFYLLPGRGLLPRR